MVEEVQQGWEKRDEASSQRILDPAEKVLTAANKWKGQGRFILRKATNVRPSYYVYLGFLCNLVV